MKKIYHNIRTLLGVISGRRYFSWFDLRFASLVNKLDQKVTLLSHKNKPSIDFYFSSYIEMIDGFNEDSRVNFDLSLFESKLNKLELKATTLFAEDRHNINVALTIKLIYRELIYYFNDNLYPQLSGLLNDSYKKIMIENQKLYQYGPVELLRLYIGKGIKNLNQNTFDTSQSNFMFYKIRLERFRLYYSILYSNNYSFKKSFKLLRLDSVDNHYHKYIVNKNVLLIGPANSFNVNEDLIEKVDLVVLLNHKGFNKTYLEIEKIISNIPIISYYSGDGDKFLNNEIIEDINRDSCFTVWSDRTIRSRFPKLDPLKIKGFRNHDSLIEFGRWNFALYTIIDILIYEPKLIYITGVNLFIEDGAEKLYINNYPSSKNSYEKVKSICLHNPYEQFSLFKELYENNKIYPDIKLEKILDMGVHKYLQLLWNNVIKEVL